MNNKLFDELKHLLPDFSEINDKGHLQISGLDLVDLVSKFGSPLYIYEENTIRNLAKSFKEEFESRYKNVHVSYSSKAFSNPALVKILNEEGLGIDVVSRGELEVLLRSEFPMNKVNFHGNNKSEEELAEAIDQKIGLITIDSFHEMNILDKLCEKRAIKQDIILRLSPSVDPHTHELTSTGILDTKFGFSIETGEAKKALQISSRKNNLNLKGIHFHLGSPIFELNPYSQAINYVFDFIKESYPSSSDLEIFNVGGGFAVPYIIDDQKVEIEHYAETICKSVKKKVEKLGMAEPQLVIEPGRAIVARSGVAIYTVGGIKEIPKIRTYVSVDGGMADNIRPALYGAKYSTISVNKTLEPHINMVTIAGKYCETGDKLSENTLLPQVEPGDLIAILTSGAYNISMSSNYNMSLRPAILLLNNGISKVIKRRETYDDLLSTSNL